MAPAILCDALSKRFRRGGAGPLAGWFSRRGAAEPFWALRDVAFDVQPGEAVGIIGPNGAGKSTLLKLLSRILTPTSGTLDVHGRLTALIEVGAGFHRDLTGRENIFLNAAILGMSRRDTLARLPDIVAFAGVGDFIDTPVKRYSSGMQARLGFAVAAHMDPEILLVDEVLAVGDTEFQKRCVERMQHFVRSGRTVVFISHDLQAVASLCGRALLIAEGRVRADGPTADTIAHYLALRRGSIPGPALAAALDEVRVTDTADVPTTRFNAGETARVHVRRPAELPAGEWHLQVRLTRLTDELLVAEDTVVCEGGAPTVAFEMAINCLTGSYAIHLTLLTPQGRVLAQCPFAARIDVVASGAYAGVVHLAPRILHLREAEA